MSQSILERFFNSGRAERQFEFGKCKFDDDDSDQEFQDQMQRFEISKLKEGQFWRDLFDRQRKRGSITQSEYKRVILSLDETSNELAAKIVKWDSQHEGRCRSN